VYEPAWAIGAEHAAGPEHVRGVVEHVKALLRDRGATDPEVLYGGTVNEGNVEAFAALDVLDGVGAHPGQPGRRAVPRSGRPCHAVARPLRVRSQPPPVGGERWSSQRRRPAALL
jgi:triosephosphate isomerase-like protein